MTTIEQARAVEQRLREIANPNAHPCFKTVAADTIASLIAELEAVTNDAARYRWLRDEAFNSFVADHMTVYPRNTLDQSIDAEIAAGVTK